MPAVVLQPLRRLLVRPMTTEDVRPWAPCDKGSPITFVAKVIETGGGYVTLMVRRDTLRYPREGSFVTVSEVLYSDGLAVVDHVEPLAVCKSYEGEIEVLDIDGDR